MVQFNCTSCKKRLMVPDEYVGNKVKCPKCSQINTVPGLSDQEGSAKKHEENFILPADTNTRKCPYCQETILKAATKCKHCGAFSLDPKKAFGERAASQTWYRSVLNYLKSPKYAEAISILCSICGLLVWLYGGYVFVVSLFRTVPNMPSDIAKVVLWMEFLKLSVCIAIGIMFMVAASVLILLRGNRTS